MTESLEISCHIHASCVLLADAATSIGAPSDAGVLLLGRSGAGKSDMALRLMERGARLVADDRTELYVSKGAMMARAPQRLAGMLEVRGLGILRVPHAETARIAMCVQLDSSPVERLPELAYYDPPPELALTVCNPIPLVLMDPRHSSATAKIAAAVAGYASGGFQNTINVLDRGCRSQDIG